MAAEVRAHGSQAALLSTDHVEATDRCGVGNMRLGALQGGAFPSDGRLDCHCPGWFHGCGHGAATRKLSKCTRTVWVALPARYALTPTAPGAWSAALVSVVSCCQLAGSLAPAAQPFIRRVVGSVPIAWARSSRFVPGLKVRPDTWVSSGVMSASTPWTRRVACR